MSEPDVANLNRLCDARGWPRSLDDKGHVTGLWYCGTYRKTTLYGQYPPTYLDRLMALFTHIPHDRVLHCPSGTVAGPGVTVDLVRDDARRPQVLASADALPFPDDTFSLYAADPPYSKEDAKRYGTPPFPIKAAIREAHRVLEPGGILAMLHQWQPSTNRDMWRTRGLVAVCCGPQKRVRVLTLMQKNGWQLATRRVPHSGAKKPNDMPLFAAEETPDA